MIRDIAELLTAFQKTEIEAIQRSGITHAPTSRLVRLRAKNHMRALRGPVAGRDRMVVVGDWSAGLPFIDLLRAEPLESPDFFRFPVGCRRSE